MGPAKPSSSALDSLQRLAEALVSFPASRKVWEEVLTEEERHSLGGDHNSVFAARKTGGAVNMARAVWNCSEQEAIVRIHESLGTLAPQKIAWLRRELGQVPAESTVERSRSTPIWNESTCEIMFRGKVVRKFRGKRVAKHCVAIVQTFAERGWPERIENPPELRDSVVRAAAIRSLNSKIEPKTIQFVADGSGSGICWRVAN